MLLGILARISAAVILIINLTIPMDRAGLKVDLSNDFEVRDQANLRFVDKQENIASKIAQLEIIGMLVLLSPPTEY